MFIPLVPIARIELKEYQLLSCCGASNTNLLDVKREVFFHTRHEMMFWILLDCCISFDRLISKEFVLALAAYVQILSHPVFR